MGELNLAYVTGKTVTARVLNSAGLDAAVVSCPEVLPGLYSGEMPAVAAGRWLVAFFDGAVLVGSGTIDWDGTAEVVGTVPTVEDIVVALSAIEITVQSPVDPESGAITVIQGDTYDLDESRSLAWETSGIAFDLTGATFTFRSAVLSKPLTVDGSTLVLELTAAETTALSPRAHSYNIRAALGNGHVVTIFEGKMFVRKASGI